MRERTSPASWAHTLVAVAVAIGAQALPAPGVRAPDPLALADRVSPLSWIGMFVDWTAPRLPLVDGRLVPWLAFGALAAALALGSSPTDRARMVARYGLLAGLVVVAAALGWGTFSVWSRLGVGWPHAVLVAYVCGAVVLWLVARWIDAYGAGQGALVLLLAQFVVVGAGDLASSRISSEPVLAVLDVVVVGLPSIALCVWLAFRAPEAWPVKVAGDLSLTSPLDALGVQAIGLALLSPSVLAAIPGLAAWLVVPLRLAASIAGFAIVWSALGRAPLVRARALGWLALAVGLLVAELAWPLLAANQLAPIAGAAPAGRVGAALGSTDIVLVARGGDASADGALVAGRLERLGLHADVVDTSPGRLHVVVDYAPDLRELLEIVAARGAIALRPVARDQTSLAALTALARRPLSGVTAEGSGAQPKLRADTLEALEALARDFAAPAGADVRFECEQPRLASRARPSGSVLCSPMLVEASLLGSGDVLSARSSSSIDAATVVFEVTDAAAGRARALVGSAPDGKLALLVDDRVVATTDGAAAVGAGTVLRFALGSPRVDPDVVRRAAARAATLSTGPLGVSWSVRSFGMSAPDSR